MTFKQALFKSGMNIERLADLTALEVRTIKSYYYGERIPSELNQGRIERVLKTKIKWR